MSTSSLDGEIFIADMIEKYQRANSPSDRDRVDAMVRMAVINGQISEDYERSYHEQKATKFLI